MTVKRVALTGGIATGKSHVRAIFDELGVPTIDADTLAREVVSPGTPALVDIVSRFGPSVVDASGQLDRRALAAIIFADPSARRALESIVHPGVRQRTTEWFSALDAASTVPYAIADIPLLYETGRDRDFATVIVAAADPGTQVTRVMQRDHLGESDARARLAAQLPIADKVARADIVIWTDRSFDDTRRQVIAAHAVLSNN